ncbi:hypothetical protein [Hymenobacter rubripertinctus]|uniref:Periplasmic heavy metal sensor n=1 Tax=Hymenobacter rubripertinctus TaxID=2029981 RepID=A0A418R7L2_9BACT|nr:hypothetical protein [Hymenobacter rubripertinctus]RIY13284.1 hypothetical protein D0T11_02285 [Hymenobacter rubripertinctus]
MNHLLRTLSLLCLLAVLPLAGAHAQRGDQRQERLSQLENARIAYLTEKIALTPDQAQKFWPLYNEFTAKRRDLNRRLRQLRPADADGLSDQQLRDNINQSFGLRQQEITLEKDYFDKFQRVITVRQVGRLFLAERQFTREVLKRVAGRPGMNAGAADGPDD